MTTHEIPILAEGSVTELEQALRGRLVRPTDDDYDERRAIWNGVHDRHPALIARCAGVADVMRALEFARSEELPIAVRAGGHSIPGFSSVDGGIVIDLSAMKGIQVDPRRRTARVQPGVTWAELDHETQAFGLATTGGLVSSTGVAGLTLGGGIGWLMRKHGLACDNLIAADVVTADGRFLHASRARERRPLLGPARRRRQLRHRHLARVPAARRRPDDHRRRRLLSRRARAATCCAPTATGSAPRPRS